MEKHCFTFRSPSPSSSLCTSWKAACQSHYVSLCTQSLNWAGSVPVVQSFSPTAFKIPRQTTVGLKEMLSSFCLHGRQTPRFDYTTVGAMQISHHWHWARNKLFPRLPALQWWKFWRMQMAFPRRVPFLSLPCQLPFHREKEAYQAQFSPS